MDAAQLEPAAIPPDALVEHARFVRRVAFAMLRDDADADDAAQDALAKGLVAGPSDPAARRSWLATVVRNVARRLRRREVRVAAREHAAARPEPTLSASDAASRSETIRRVGDAVAALAEPGRTAVLLRHYDGLAPREIAERLGVPVETVKSRLKRAHEDLRLVLDRGERGGATPWRAVLGAFVGIGGGAHVPTAPSADPSSSGPVSMSTASKAGLGVAAAAGLAIVIVSVVAPSPRTSTPTAPTVAPAVVPPTLAPTSTSPKPEPAQPAPIEVPEPPAPTRPPEVSAFVPLAPPAPAESPIASTSPTPAPASSLSPKPAMESEPSLASAEPVAAPPTPAPPAPSGMVWVDVTASRPRIGTRAEHAFRLTEKRSREVQVEVGFEVPAHEVSLRPYFLDQHEVTNAQYRRFLDETRKATVKTGAALSTLEDIASTLAYGSARAAEQKKDRSSWAQLYELNRQTLHDAMPALRRPAIRQSGDPGGFRKDDFRRAALPPDLELRGYRARLPRHWFTDSDRLEGDAVPNHPVRDVSYLEAQAFAEWAGKHVPTEAEFEWAARGTSMSEFPWGDDWTEGVVGGRRLVETRCNWLGLGKKSAKTLEPTTVAVDEMPAGRSWCGAHHLVGNVSEWTSSWFDAYPGWPGDPTTPWTAYFDRYVRVIRGGSCADSERLALRSAHRNFIGVERLAPPLPGNHFDYTGFRCAQYLQPALDRVEPTLDRVLRLKRLRRDEIATDRFAGTSVVHFVPAGATATDHVYVTGSASTVFVVPTTSIFGFPGDGREVERPRARTPAELLALAPDPDADPFVLGILSTDVDLARVRLLVPPDPAARGRGPARRGARAAVPATREGDLARGTYVLGLAHGAVALYQPNFDLVGFLAPPTVTSVRTKPGELPPSSSMEVNAAADSLQVQFWIAIGGKGMDPGDGALIRFAMSTAAGQLEKAQEGSSWR